MSLKLMNNTQKATENLVIIGDNIIADAIYTDFKRYGKYKLSHIYKSSQLKGVIDNIIDCTINIQMQNTTIKYCGDNNVKKLLIFNNIERKKLPNIKTIILQGIIYDIIDKNHPSFSRNGFGNDIEPIIQQNSFISELIRRTNDAKYCGYPFIRLLYNLNYIKYINIDALYGNANNMLNTLKENSTYAIYDDEISIYTIVSLTQHILDYKGEIILYINENKQQHNNIKRLNYKPQKDKIDYLLKKIYRYLTFNNPRFFKC